MASSSKTDSSKNQKPDSIREALRVLDEALGRESGPALQDLVGSDFSNLSAVIGGASGQSATASHMESRGDHGPGIGAKISDSISGVKESVRDRSSHVYERVNEIAGSIIEPTRDVSRRVDSEMRRNPWPVLGGIAVGTFVLGYLLGRRQYTTSAPADIRMTTVRTDSNEEIYSDRRADFETNVSLDRWPESPTGVRSERREIRTERRPDLR